MGSAKIVCITLACCLAVVAAQTFQYSKGWTNGRKRAALTLGMQQQRRAAELALEKALVVLGEAGLMLVPASCVGDVHRPRFKLVQRKSLQFQPLADGDDSRVAESLTAPLPSEQQRDTSADAVAGGSERALGRSDGNTFSF
ncbi:uncharacterized protein LOC135945790 [Cloeon dipterum]|uniref:uncharacterized protein LOC135945790 n=1 Tax=Cloeon dipterum TaxID=197152 RepID=UPI0032206B04